MRVSHHSFAGAVVAGCALALAFLISGCGKPEGTAPSAKPDGAPAVVPAEFGPLKGRWVRQDGDYMIEIKSVAADGTMEAGYFNPRPIHIGKAEAELRDGVVRVFVLMADRGYPGSNYKLKYDKESDTLQGSYHQAASGETFGVIFDRLKGE